MLSSTRYSALKSVGFQKVECYNKDDILTGTDDAIVALFCLTQNK
ncbi:hypothetical protein [Nostoc commune]|nr:hypothetical protein [Nostoc commune]